MKKLIFALTISLLASALPLSAAEPAKGAADAGVNNDKLLYSLGYMMGENIKDQLVLERGEEDSKAISQGLRDSLLDRNSQTDLDVYKPLVVKRYEEDRVKKIANRKIDEAKELDNIKKQKDVKTLPNGVAMRIVKEGDKKAKSPKATSIVKVNYEGSLLNGKVFDSSFKRNMPAQFALNGVIPCWTETLQKMKVGDKAKLFCPPNTAYGDSQAGAIPPGSMLIFDVELLEVND